MKKTALLNSEISYVISKLGHGDSLVIGDSGLPIHDGVKRIDLAVKKGIPSFIDVLDAVLSEQRVEEVVLARETKQASPVLYESIISRLKDIEKQEGITIKLTEVSHEELKHLTGGSKAVIRTGEFTSYANIILKSGVVF